ncbi:Six-hairpin glycosidase [Venustampulla echinocandica]|uniref:alpha-L-rhamnosidase n=1 Tax=Venustampulla echinocandica TaxID=2656787 RepID=A0A370TB84_9HELO|nr:Six-hairpin glycosidase [Venustampulla echinocandica]RDL31187.1 Six-hairpin glycosidase [Venustampulla echinocandica]
MSISISSVSIEHHRPDETLGIGESTPRISWRFAGDAKNWIQHSYEIEISRLILPATGEKELRQEQQIFKSKSQNSVLVPWPSPNGLKSRERASVRVRATGGDGDDAAKLIETEWSDSSVVVEAGLLERKDWKAHIIAAKATSLTSSGSRRPILFRKPFKVSDSKVVLSARLYITSYGVYEARINGVRVGDHVLAPGWTSYNHRLCYQTFDVTDLMRVGENAVGVEVGEGWYVGRLGFDGGKRCIYGERLAVLAQLEVIFDDGEKLEIVSDENWKSSVGPIVGSEIYDGELYDASKEVHKWSIGEFTDHGWEAVEILDFPQAKLISPEGPPIREIETLKPKDIFRSPSNKVIVDFGQNFVGGVRFRASGSQGQRIILTHTEVLERGEVATRPLRDCKARDVVMLGGEDIEWAPKFTFHGFRYVQVEGWPSDTGEPAMDHIEAFVIHTDMEPTGWFECSEPMVNRLWQNIQWGMRGNFVGIPTDCPQRDERLGWTGDIQVFAPTANFLYDTSGMLSSWLKDLAVEQIKDSNGIVPQVIPNVLEANLNTAQAVWGDAAVITPWDVYVSFGDRDILQNQYKSMTTWLKSIPRTSQENPLWDPTSNQLGDWLDPFAPPSQPANGKTDPHFIANAYLTHISQLVYEISIVLSRPDSERNHLCQQAGNIKEFFQHQYITPAGRLAPDTMTSLSLALTFNLFDSDSHTDFARDRLARLVRQSQFRICTGFVGTPLICAALSSGKYNQLAYRMLLEKGCPSWLYPITMGATTMWERWDSMLPNGRINEGSMTSFNHYAFGSVGAWLFGVVGGMTIFKFDVVRKPCDGEGIAGTCADGDLNRSEGWRVIHFAPQPGGTITWAKTSHLSPYGLISSDWQLDTASKVFKLAIQVPPNSRGLVQLPGKGNGEETGKLIHVGSGKWEFEVVGYEVADGQEWPPSPVLDPFAQYE